MLLIHTARVMDVRIHSASIVEVSTFDCLAFKLIVLEFGMLVPMRYALVRRGANTSDKTIIKHGVQPHLHLGKLLKLVQQCMHSELACQIF